MGWAECLGSKQGCGLWPSSSCRELGVPSLWGLLEGETSHTHGRRESGPLSRPRITASPASAARGPREVLHGGTPLPPPRVHGAALGGTWA